MAAHFKSELAIDLPPDKIWAALTDFSAFDQWNPMVKRASGRLELGRKVVLHLRPLPFPIRAKIRGLTSGRELRWGGGLPVLLDIEHYFQIEADGDGARFVHGEVFGGLLGPLVAKLAKIETRQYEHYNQKLAERAAQL